MKEGIGDRLVSQSGDFAGHMLQVLLGNTLLYMVVYLALKLVQGERLRWYAWAWLGGAAAAWAPALYFFISGSSDWSTAPALSRHRNHHCMVLVCSSLNCFFLFDKCDFQNFMEPAIF